MVFGRHHIPVALKFPEGAPLPDINGHFAGAGAGANGVTVRAKFGYLAAQKDELSFPVDAIITEVVQKDGGWWLGRYADMKGWLPSNYVVVVEDQIGPDYIAANTPDIIMEYVPLGGLTSKGRDVVFR